MSKKTITGYKAFNKDMTCRGFQYEVGKEFVIDQEIKLCEKGFHFCENPLDTLSYYPLIGSVFAEVEATGKTEKDNNKVVTNKLFIKGNIGIDAFIKASVDFIWKKASSKKIFGKNKATSGNYAHSATSGERANSATSGYGAHSATSGYGAHSATSGNYAHSATSGNYAHSATSGERANSATSGYGAHSATSTQNGDAIACAIGRKAKAKASLGCWIVLAEWKEGKEFTDAKPIVVKSVKVDGKKIKADQWYKLVKGKFVETDDSNEYD